MLKYKKDLIVISGILICALLILLIMHMVKTGDFVEITVDGKMYEISPLSENKTIQVETDSGCNTVVIENGEVYVKEADCKDHYCMKQRRLPMGNALICLPHKMVVRVRGKHGGGEFDA